VPSPLARRLAEFAVPPSSSPSTCPPAVGTSLLVIAVNSATALAAGIGAPVHLKWPVLAAFTATAIAGGLLGGPVVSRVRPDRLSTTFTLLLVAVAIYTGARSLPHLF
jgi:uncharacterized membrane protein YfcA